MRSDMNSVPPPARVLRASAFAKATADETADRLMIDKDKR
jgi:hypothetical protein